MSGSASASFPRSQSHERAKARPRGWFLDSRPEYQRPVAGDLEPANSARTALGHDGKCGLRGHEGNALGIRYRGYPRGKPHWTMPPCRRPSNITRRQAATSSSLLSLPTSPGTGLPPRRIWRQLDGTDGSPGPHCTKDGYSRRSGTKGSADCLDRGRNGRSLVPRCYGLL